nr:P21 [Xylella fastidiosa]ADF29441.1 P21 [Xylella fastidiosa]ADF29471.1 P21 [Xylella fastidiosa]ADF29501.1 P21 [Xylella fastidiosa]
MHFLKNYDARQITKMISENGVKITLKEVKNILQNKEKKSQ